MPVFMLEVSGDWPAGRSRRCPGAVRLCESICQYRNGWRSDEKWLVCLSTLPAPVHFLGSSRAHSAHYRKSPAPISEAEGTHLISKGPSVPSCLGAFLDTRQRRRAGGRPGPSLPGRRVRAAAWGRLVFPAVRAWNWQPFSLKLLQDLSSF